MFQLPCWQNGGRAHKHRWGQVRNTNSGAVETWLETHKKAKFQGKYSSKPNKNTKGIDWYPCFQVQMRHVGKGKGERRPSHLSLDQVSSWHWWTFLVDVNFLDILNPASPLLVSGDASCNGLFSTREGRALVLFEGLDVFIMLIFAMCYFAFLQHHQRNSRVAWFA